MADEPVHEKPYDFVPIADKPTNNTAAGHHLVAGTTANPRISGILCGSIVSESLVSIASGYVIPMDAIKGHGDIEMASIGKDQLVASHIRSGGQRIIPGSSLKGAIRSVVEAITASGMQFTPRAKSKTVKKHTVLEIKNRVSNQQLPAPPELPSISLVNRLFGLTSGRHGYQGQCSFYDAPQVHGTGRIFRRLPLYRPQPDYSEGDPSITTNWWRYFGDSERKSYIGRKFYRVGKSQEVHQPYTAVEACSIGSAFTFTMHFNNLTEIELGVLLIALGANGQIPYMKIGGGKPVSFGTVRFTNLSITALSPESYHSFDTVSQAIDIATCVTRATQSNELFESGLEKLSAIMTQPATFTAGGEERVY